MSELIGRWIPGFDPAAGLVVPLWAAGALAALIVVLCVLIFSRAGRDGLGGALSRVFLILIGAGVTWFVLDGSLKRDLAIERQALDARASELTARAIAPGSALACLDGAAGEQVEASCEKALFATPEATAAAVTYVAAQLALLADASDFAQRDPSYETTLARLRRGIEYDRFGFVAHVLAVREGCTPDQCRTFELLNDPARVTANLTERAYDFYVVRHSAAWPAIAGPPAPRLSSVPAAPQAGTTGRVPGPNVFFPSSASIPPVNIMNAEPQAAPQETTGTAVPAASAKPPAPPRRPPAAPQAKQQPVDLNAAPVRPSAPAPGAQ